VNDANKLRQRNMKKQQHISPKAPAKCRDVRPLTHAFQESNKSVSRIFYFMSYIIPFE